MGLLQLVQHRAPPGLGVSRLLQIILHLRPADVAGRKCSGETAREQTQFAAGNGAAAGDECGVSAGFGNRLAVFRAALHQREFVGGILT